METLLAASIGAAVGLGALVVIVWAMRIREDQLRRLIENGERLP